MEALINEILQYIVTTFKYSGKYYTEENTLEYMDISITDFRVFDIDCNIDPDKFLKVIEGVNIKIKNYIFKIYHCCYIIRQLKEIFFSNPAIVLSYQVTKIEYRSYFQELPHELYPLILSYLRYHRVVSLIDQEEFPEQVDNCDIYKLIFMEKYHQLSDINHMLIIPSYKYFCSYLENVNIDVSKIIKSINNYQYFDIQGRYSYILYEYALLKRFPEIAKNLKFKEFSCDSIDYSYRTLCSIKKDYPHLVNKITQKVLSKWYANGFINIKDIE